MISSLLIVNPPENLKFEDLGPTLCDDIEKALQLLTQHRFGVVVIFSTESNPQATLKLIHKSLSKDSHLILCASQWSASDWIDVTSQVRCDALFRDFNSVSAIRDALSRALEAWQEERQDADFIHMVSESNMRLAANQVELQDRVARRQKSLARSLARLQNTIKYFEALKASFVAVHQARSLKEMEDLLLGAIVPSIPLSSLHLRYASQTSLPQSLVSNDIKGTESLPLMIGDVKIGDLVVIPANQSPLDSAQKNFLTRVAEAATLGLDRLAKLEQAEIVKQEWETTFDAISEPLCLTDLQFKIIKTNKAFSHEAKQSFRSLIGQNCFTAFFKAQDVPHHLAETDLKFRRDKVVKRQSRTFEISIQASPIEVQDQEVILVLMRDITSRLVLERKIVEASKQAELGLIGSSIAHELNNPLGGMLSFVQLIRMDLNEKSPFWNDVREMESAAHRCKDIVQNLLGFARRSDSSERATIDINDAITQAIRITELKSRPQGIPIHFTKGEGNMLVCGQANQLTQALCNLLQNSVEAVLARRHQSSRDRGDISITSTEQGDQIVVEISDTGIGFDATITTKIFNPLFTTKSPIQNPGLGLTVARRILADHHGSLEIFSQTGVGTKAVIALPMAERPAQSRDFDSKI